MLTSTLAFVDNFLNKITMYRLVLYFLIILLGIAVVFGFLGILPYNPWMLLLSTAILLAVCYASNLLFAKIYNAPTNFESFYITALILALIINPPTSLTDGGYFIFIALAAFLAMASKYILAIGKKHIFNPAAFAVALTAYAIGESASWWVGTVWMMPFVLIGGLLITRKLKRFDLVLSFIGVSLAMTTIIHATTLIAIPKIIEHTLLASPLLFFAFVMLTEPLTTPPTRDLRMGYGAFLGAIFDPVVHLGSFYSTPELALLVGNIFSYLVSPKKKLILKLKEKKKIADDTYDFAFASDKGGLKFRPGQYIEWTLGHKKVDSRGNRRYFTIASAPGNTDVHIGVKFYPEPSTFKEELLQMPTGGMVVASQLAGDFTLASDLTKKLCFIAGGIGVTPFQSMILHMLDQKENKKEKRDVKMFYSNRKLSDIAYGETFEKAKKELGLETIFTLADKDSIPKEWAGERGFVTADMLKKYMPDYAERMYFISGPRSMVTAFQKTLSEMGIHQSHIKVDFFPGFA